MAEFNLWSRESLVLFAEEATEAMKHLVADNKALHEAWRKAVSPDTLTPHHDENDHRRTAAPPSEVL